jgi:hypothetical protein
MMRLLLRIHKENRGAVAFSLEILNTIPTHRELPKQTQIKMSAPALREEATGLTRRVASGSIYSYQDVRR